MGASSALLLSLKKVGKGYRLGNNEIPVLFNIHLDVHEGEFAVIMGPSGSGKSTLLNILGCLDLPDSGEFHFDGQRIAELSSTGIARFRNTKLGFVFQNFNLFNQMTVEQNVGLPLIYGDLSPLERKERVETLLKRLHIWERRRHRPMEISGGQKQRTAIARALINKPRLVLADEPTGNLDTATTRDIMTLFQELHQDGHAIVLITHDPAVAAYGQTRYRLIDGHLSHDTDLQVR
ncbi:MAG: macrolide ABC transporter ATP-binding protein [Elusimicrobia bacterium RIFOXYB2_FULL_49_7]|nr:MAG: macrolide ABC transporter ATP-binding protein [Elusimicrobia bacterium RIFOXYB2_FULL_49_7]